MIDRAQQDDIEAFLLQAQLVNQKVKALAENKISLEQFDALQNKRIIQIQKKEQKKQFQQEQIRLAKIKGVSGKGISKDFKNFCRSCHLQYQFETPKCLKCDKKTMTLEQRQKQLVQMVDNYRIKKAHKEARRQKWQMWKKTQSMLPTKLSTQYTKWEAYTSSQQQEQNQQPIVPKDDPNFKALEMDLQQRKKRKEQSDKKANSYKQKGNKLMGQKKYQQAADNYSLALQQVKDNKVLYTNRALAYIKLGKWQRAITDCSTVIQYMQVFEKLDECKDLAFKAFSRRALAHKQRKQFTKALSDIETALVYNKKDQSALRLKTQIQNFIKFEQQSDDFLKSQQTKQIEQIQEQYNQKDIIRQLVNQTQSPQDILKNNFEKQHQAVIQQSKNVPKDPVEKMKYCLQQINSTNIELLLNLLISQPNLKAPFIKLEGVKKILKHIEKQQDKGKAIVLLSYLMDGNGIAEQQVWNSNPHSFENKCLQILKSQIKIDTYSQLQDYFQIFVSLSLNEKYRLLLSGSQQTISFIKKCYPILITKFKKQPQVLNAFIIYFSNLCKGDTKIKQSFVKEIKPVIQSLTRIIITQTKNKKVHQLQKSIYILISNLITEPSIKQEVLASITLLQIASTQLKIYPKSSQIYDQFIESILSVFVNLLFQSNETTINKISQLNLSSTLFQRFIAPNKINQCFLRAFNVFSKLNYKDVKIPKQYITKLQKYFQKEYIEKGATNHVLRLFNNIYSVHKDLNLPEKLDQICQLLNQENQILFCNTCNLLGVWTDNPKHSTTYFFLRKYIPRLINIAKQKIGNVRKSSAILLAKIARDQQSKPIFIANHGMDVLKSIANVVLNKK